MVKRFLKWVFKNLLWDALRGAVIAVSVTYPTYLAYVAGKPPWVLALVALAAFLLTALAVSIFQHVWLRSKNPHPDEAHSDRVNECFDGWLHDIAKDQAQTIYRFAALARCVTSASDLLRDKPYVEFQVIVDNRSVYDLLFELDGAISFNGRELNRDVKWLVPPDILRWGNETSFTFRANLTHEDAVQLLEADTQPFDFSRLQIKAKGASTDSSVITRPLNWPTLPTNEVLLVKYPKLAIVGRATYYFPVNMKEWNEGFSFGMSNAAVITLSLNVNNARETDVGIASIRFTTTLSNEVYSPETSELYEERIIDGMGQPQVSGKRLKNLAKLPLVFAGKSEITGHLEFLIEKADVLQIQQAVGTLTLIDANGLTHKQTFKLESFRQTQAA